MVRCSCRQKVRKRRSRRRFCRTTVCQQYERCDSRNQLWHTDSRPACTLRRSVLVMCTLSPVSVFLVEHLRIRVFHDVAVVSHRKLKPWHLFRLVFLRCPASLLCCFSHLGCTLNHHRSTDILRDTPCVKCRRLESKMRAFVLSEVNVTRLGFEDAGVAPLPPRFRNFLDEAVKAIALCLVSTPS